MAVSRPDIENRYAVIWVPYAPQLYPLPFRTMLTQKQREYSRTKIGWSKDSTFLRSAPTIATHIRKFRHHVTRIQTFNHVFRNDQTLFAKPTSTSTKA